MKQSSKSTKCSCGGGMKQTKLTRTIPLAGRSVEVENIKASICEACGEIYLDGPSILEIEARILKQPMLAKT